MGIIKAIKGVGKAYLRNKESKKAFNEVSGLHHPVISKVKPATNLTNSRKTFKELTESVDKQYSGRPITPKGSKIKRDAVIKGSHIHDKYEKLQKILDKSK